MISLFKLLFTGHFCRVILLFLLLAIGGGNVAFAETTSETPSVMPSNYIVLRGGPGWAEGSTRSPIGGQGSSEMHFKSEYDINLAYGYRFFNWLRLEGELGYVYMKLDEHTLSKTGETKDISGHDRHLKGMLNVYADWYNSTAFTPFVGAGIGLARVHLDTDFIRSNSQPAKTDDKDTAFAYQFMAGVAWAFHPSWELELMYKYYATNDRIHDNHSAATYPEVDVNGTKSSFVQLGLRFCF